MVSSSGNRAVRMVRLDDYASEHDLPFPSWIKIDIEGLELPALKGAERIIREARPRIICEINRLHGRFGTTVAEFLRYMRSHDYEIHRLANGVLTPISGADSFAALGYSADWNFWFLPR